MLVKAHTDAADFRTRLLVAVNHRTVLRPLGVTQLDRLLKLFPDLESARIAASSAAGSAD